MHTQINRRILIVDDNRAIHGDFRKILCEHQADAIGILKDLEAGLFGTAPSTQALPVYQLDSAYQGQEALGMVIAARDAGLPYAVVFVDMRMPPGWDGAQTLERLWQADPALQMVLCTAYSDYTWEDILARFGAVDH